MNKYTKILKLFFVRIIMNYCIVLENKLNENSSNNNDIHNKELNKLELKTNSLLNTRNNDAIKQSDMCDDVFRILIDCKYDRLYVLEIMIYYITLIRAQKVQIYSKLISLLIEQIKLINEEGRRLNREIIIMLIQYQSIPDNLEFAEFLVKDYFIHNDIHSIGLDILKRLRKYDTIVVELFKKEMLTEALQFIKKHKITLTSISSELKDKIKILFEESKNRKIINDYLNS